MGKKKRAEKKNSSPSYIRSYINRVVKMLFIFTVTLSITVGSILGGAFIGFIKSTDPISPDMLKLKGFTSSIYDCNGNFVMNLTAGTNREVVDIKEVPQYLKDAFVAIEDKRFYKHNGIDLKRLAGAVINYFKHSGGTYGGSTITQQVVKNVTGEKEHSIKRKIQEQWRAINLEKNLTKEEILEVYMNLIYMGENCYGVQSASKMYFGKPVSELTLAQSASLAGITNLPSKYDPFTKNGKENNLKRQKVILKEMLDLGFITKDEYEKAKVEDVCFVEKNSGIFNKEVQPYFVDQLVKDLKEDLMKKGYSAEMAKQVIYNNGLKIYSTIDLNVQKSLDKVFEDERNFPIVSSRKGKPQAAMVILDAKTGEIRGMTGGIGKKKDLPGMPLNRATAIQRQPGSTFKPISVYGPAINEGIINAATVIDDVPVYMLGGSELYPHNANRKYNGLTTIREGVMKSVNVVAARAWKEHLGADLSLDYLKKVNIDRSNERYVSLALGGLKEGVNPLQMASAYLPFVNKGEFCEAKTYTKVCDKDGNVLINKETRKKKVYSENAAYVMTNILQDVPRRGTAYPKGIIRKGQIESAGKTGTTSNNRDKWYVGYTPYYIGVTWYGYDKNSILGHEEYGKALDIWNKVMEDVHKDLEPKKFEKPETGIVERRICKCSGKLATDLCYHDQRGSMVVNEIFVEGTEPKEGDYCDVHVKVKVCTESNGMQNRDCLANDFCPNTEEKIYIKRPEPYIPKQAGEPAPKDRGYEVPTNKCKVHEVENNRINIFSGLDDAIRSIKERKENEAG